MGSTAGPRRGHLVEPDNALGHDAGVPETDPAAAAQEAGPKTRPRRGVAPCPRAYRCSLRAPTDELSALRHGRGCAHPPAYTADRGHPSGAPAGHRPHHPRLLVWPMQDDRYPQAQRGLAALEPGTALRGLYRLASLSGGSQCGKLRENGRGIPGISSQLGRTDPGMEELGHASPRPIRSHRAEDPPECRAACR